jgi:3-dehydroquinate synthase
MKHCFIYFLLASNNKRPYNITIGDNYYSTLFKKPNSLVVTNTRLNDYYKNYLPKHTFIIPDGESYKTLNTVSSIIDYSLENKLDRQSSLISFGGGVVGDLCGFVSNIYMRGIGHVLIPTTLMAMVDSCIGGKTGVNHHLGKNLIGTFYQPTEVCIDISLLKTLPDREYKSGIAEIIKYALIKDSKFFDWLENNMDLLLKRDKITLLQVIKKCCKIKTSIVEMDSLEQGNERQYLNFGHTFGHAIEKEASFGKYLHGEALSIGIILESKLSCLKRTLKKEEYSRILKLFEKIGLPTQLPPEMDIMALYKTMQFDKKNRDGKIYMIFLNGIGDSYCSNFNFL